MSHKGRGVRIPDPVQIKHLPAGHWKANCWRQIVCCSFFLWLLAQHMLNSLSIIFFVMNSQIFSRYRLFHQNWAGPLSFWKVKKLVLLRQKWVNRTMVIFGNSCLLLAFWVLRGLFCILSKLKYFEILAFQNPFWLFLIAPAGERLKLDPNQLDLQHTWLLNKDKRLYKRILFFRVILNDTLSTS